MNGRPNENLLRCMYCKYRTLAEKELKKSNRRRRKATPPIIDDVVFEVNDLEVEWIVVKENEHG